jgi:TRAP-type transport system periplasmic protein
MYFKFTAAAVLVAASLATSAIAQEVRDLRLGPASPPPHPAYANLYVPFEAYLPEESGGRLTGTIYGMDVAGLKEMKSAIQTGLIDIGLVLPTYFPADFPEISLTGELALLGRNPHAMTAAVTEYIVTCQECQAEMAAYGGVFLASGSSDVYGLISTKPIRSLKDLSGLKIRATTETFARLVTAAGAVPVNIPSNDTFESMSQGTLDASVASVGDLLSQRLIDVAKYVTRVKIGTFHTTSGFTVGQKTWESLSVEDRAAVARAATRANVDFSQGWGYDLAAKAIQAGKDAGIEILEPDADLVDFVNGFAQTDSATAAENAEKNYGIKNAAEKLDRLKNLIKKWNAVAESVNNDPAAMVKAINEEVWSKVDFATYGL